MANVHPGLGSVDVRNGLFSANPEAFTPSGDGSTFAVEPVIIQANEAQEYNQANSKTPLPRSLCSDRHHGDRG